MLPCLTDFSPQLMACMQLIWIYTVCKGRAYLSSAGQVLKITFILYSKLKLKHLSGILVNYMQEKDQINVKVNYLFHI